MAEKKLLVRVGALARTEDTPFSFCPPAVGEDCFSSRRIVPCCCPKGVARKSCLDIDPDSREDMTGDGDSLGLQEMPRFLLEILCSIVGDGDARGDGLAELHIR
eukprot:CAMPEP_0206426964 /NCGR_PEP_ID=MMETSP0324_2-20121206/4733_1 /ASSEMBLY_ACC=CAM_ASM_000836 /TAXON_ID=2866 /ORGANISM="Crypthecodinium cohnii, Strain Seligo" /LENGTH=103 /DNA_ID=CAMNT_0053892103 /DNA_START=396 /DNA_END=703 /DNA_ORIENTATION=+